MDIDDLRNAVTVVSFLIFMGIVLWAMSSRNKRAFEEARQLPFLDSEGSTCGTSAGPLPSRPAVPSGDGAMYSSREGLQ